MTREAAAAHVHLGQRVAAVGALLVGRVEGEDDALAVGRDVEGVGVGLGARQLVAACPRTGRARRPLREVDHVQVRHAAHRQVVVPEAVLRLAGGVAGFLALLEFLVALGLRLGALQLGPDPGDEGEAPAVGEPAEGVDAGGDVADARRLAAVGRDHVELRLFVLAALLLALGDEGDQVAARADQRGLPSLSPQCVSRRGSPPSVDSSHSDACALVVVHRVAASASTTACAPSGDRLACPGARSARGRRR